MYNLEEFEAYLIKNRGMRGNSSRTYRFHVNEFLKHFEKPPEQISNSEIIDYLDYLRKEEKQGTNSRRLAKTAIERFYAWFSVQNSINNPAKELPVIKEYISDPRMTNPDEIEQLILACDQFRSDYLKKRNAAIIALLASTGIRAEEFEKIRVGDFSIIREKGVPKHIELSVNAVKGSNARVVPFNAFDSKNLCNDVFTRYYLYVLTETSQKSNDPFFWVTTRHGYDQERDIPLTRHGINTMLDALVKKAYIDKKRVNIHSFRHFYATYSIVNRIDILSLQRLMGHARVTTTQRYIHIASRVTGELLKSAPIQGIRGNSASAGFTALGKDLLKRS